MTKRISLIMPQLDLPHHTATVCLWHRSCGRQVDFGEPLIEVVAGEVLIDIPAPATGVLAEKYVQNDDVVSGGQLLGIIECR